MTENHTPAVEVKLDHWDVEKFYTDVVAAAAKSLLYNRGMTPDGDNYERPNDLQRELRKVVNDAVRDFAAEVARPILEEALAGPIIQVNKYGESTGQKITLREMIASEVKEQLKVPVGQSYDRRKTLLGQVIEEEVGKALREELNQALNAARKAVRDATTQKAAELLAAETMRAAGIK